MPKVVDHEERRSRLGAAACAVLSRTGVAGTTVRAVAGEAGMPLATAQHYLPTRELMVRAAMAYLVDRVVRRARALPTGPSALETLRLAVVQLVPLDEERIFESRVWLMLTAEALIDEQIAAIMRENAVELRANLARLIDLARADGSIAADVDVPQAAGELATVLDGVTLRLLYAALSPAEARAEIDTHLTRLAARP
ncbi:TetR/AcrR family transcriptional regulator [Micromonospora yangpuensis]|uniref:Transcriptional regulator, TetR family n=1 Tax=Micromonospora yangpuensis TaxID=683228 RepID=A0A1C6VB35_9ACTN|nr:TetR family transcriptional regulator C-terminal domain-containing protein [Micromonospora yangpuensis]GGM23515.1 transcriptional regulator [Micromonospora yangpuensis]SCL63553.1 transcriptional regulator, TetR family [Micromonospora yangpuensis]